jgi:SAM-dependent MidA family methyltransferase
MTPVSPPNRAEAEIRDRIRRHGKITFAEFMDLALYHPAGGYYARAPEIGAKGDFFTSPGAHPAFGALLAQLLVRMRELIGKSSPFWVVELGAGNGLLSRDILGYLKALATVTVHEQLNYVAVERAAHPEKRGHVAQVMSERIPFEGMVGCILSNELLDAFPVHRFQVKGGKPYEVYVSLDGQGKFIESLGTPSSPTLGRKLEAAAHWLPEGTRGGINLAVGPWMNEVSRALKRGFVVTIDYGYEARQDSLTATPSGTLQTYFHHVSAGSPYQRIGRQDITAHVDFSAVIAEGEGHGLRPLALLSQADFLRRLGLDRFIERLRSEALPAQVREANLTGMRALMKHGGLGDFKVLIQEKATGVGDIADLLTPSGSHGQSRTAVFPLPLLDSGHTPLLEGGYPHAAWQPDSYWDEDSEIGASEDTKASEQS